MSGICGFVDFSGRPAAPERLACMAEAARHRGPDGMRSSVRGAVALCHLALHATAEAVLERQPLCSPDGAVWLVADLRLDNRGELTRDLAPTGLLPSERAAGDGEILLAAFLEWGAGCVERLLGDFAFAVWDGRSRTLLCARDPLGVKPLCFTRAGDLFCFASEAQQILHHPAIDRSLDESAMADHLAGWPQDPGRSFFRHIQRLPPGHRLLAGHGGDHLEKTWSPEWIEPASRSSRHDSVARFRELFEQSVTDRLRTQGNTVGIAMSGGLDSPSIAAVAQNYFLANSEPPKSLLAYSFVFDSLKECDERAQIRAVADRAGFETAFIQAESHWLLVDPAFNAVSLESPFQGWLSCHLEGMRLLAGRGSRVLLTGQGADDLLQGSRLVLVERLLRGESRVVADIWRYAKARGCTTWKDLYRLLVRPMLPAGLDTGMRRIGRRPLPARLPEWITPGLARRTGIAERLVEPRFGRRCGMALREVWFQLGLAPYEQAIHWQDRVAAALGIEVRHPFLDRRIAELILATSPEQIFELGCYKPLLRRAMAGILPDELRLRRDKTKLGSYFDVSLREKAGGIIKELLTAPLIASLGLVDGPKLRGSFAAYQQDSQNPEKRRTWNAVTLEIWLRRHRDTLGIGSGLHQNEALFARTIVTC